MDIAKIVEEFGKSIGKIISNKKENPSEKINIDAMDSTDIFKIMLNKYYYEGSYDKAEDLIFNELENNKSIEIYELGIKFYNELLKKDYDNLIDGNLPRKEIYQGMNDIQKFKKNI